MISIEIKITTGSDIVSMAKSINIGKDYTIQELMNAVFELEKIKLELITKSYEKKL